MIMMMMTYLITLSPEGLFKDNVINQTSKYFKAIQHGEEFQLVGGRTAGY